MLTYRAFCQLVWCLVLMVGLSVVLVSVDSVEGATAASKVTIQLKIHDMESGFQLNATKAMTKGVSGLDAVSQIVKVEYKEYRGLGAFVTSFCGVKPKKGHIWALYLDGKRSTKGISNVKLNKDSLVEWKTEKP